MATHYTKFIKENSRKEDGRQAITNAALHYKQLSSDTKKELKESFLPPPSVPAMDESREAKWRAIKRLAKQLEKRCSELGILYYIACASTNTDAQHCLIRGSQKAINHLSEPFRELLKSEENLKRRNKPDKNKLKQDFRILLKKKLESCTDGKYKRLPQKLMKQGAVQFLVRVTPNDSPCPFQETSFVLWSEFGGVGIKTLQYLIGNPDAWNLEMVKDVGVDASAVGAGVGAGVGADADEIVGDARAGAEILGSGDAHSEMQQAWKSSIALSSTRDGDALQPEFIFGPLTFSEDVETIEEVCESSSVTISGEFQLPVQACPVASSSSSNRSVRPSAPQIVYVSEEISKAVARAVAQRSSARKLSSAAPGILKRRSQ